MKPVTPVQLSVTLMLPLLLGVACPAALAQISVPVGDHTGTIVNQNGNTFDITGGTQAGANLFHSLQQFGLNQGQIANFLANSSVQNILARVTGGQASVINGLVRVTGGNSNLYLMNPAGIILGANARLDVPGSFTATTANSIGFGSAGWDPAGAFNAAGDNNYAALAGTPTTFAFHSLQPGVIINAGDLAVGSGQTLTLLGGTVINTGTLTAPDGTVTIAAVPGANLVRLSQAGSLLSLEFSPLTASPLTPSLPPPTIPQLLTGGELTHATGLTVNPDGTVQLGSSTASLPTTPGTALVNGQVSVAGRQPGGNAQIAVVGDRIALVNASLDASGLTGGTIRIGGGYQGKGTIPNAQYTYVDPTTTLRADGISPSQPVTFTPSPAHAGTVILWADQSTQFYGSISAQGGATSGNGGLVEVSGKHHLLFRGQVDTRAAAGTTGTLLLDPTNVEIRAGMNNDGDDNNGANPNPAFSFGNNADGNNGQVTVNDPAPTIIYESEFIDLNTTTNIIIQATENITIAPTLTNLFVGGNGSLTFTADADNNGSGNFSMAPTTQLNATGRSVTISGANVTLGTFQVQNANFTATNGNLTTGSIDASFGTTSNTVTLRAPNGAVTLNGTIRSGDMFRPADSTVSIEARSFRAFKPNRVAAPNDFSTENGPFVSIYAFPANQDGTRSGQVTVQFAAPNADPTPIVRGTGNPLIRIRLLQDTTFALGNQFNPAGTGSGTEGTIAVGVGFVPNAAILLQDNSFSATITQPPTGNGGNPVVGGNPSGGGSLESARAETSNSTNTLSATTTGISTVLEADQEDPDPTLTCEAAAVGDDILDISTLIPGGTTPPSTGTKGGALPPCPAGVAPRR